MGKRFSEKLNGEFVRFYCILITVNGVPVRIIILIKVSRQIPTYTYIDFKMGKERFFLNSNHSNRYLVFGN